MSTSIAPSLDLVFRPEWTTAPFTTFRAGHFIKPAATAQPTAAQETVVPTFAGAYSDLSVVSALDLDYDEPNAVVEDVEVEFVTLGQPEAVELPVIVGAPIEAEEKPLSIPCRHAA